MGLLRTIAYCLRLRHHDKQTPARITADQFVRLRELVRFAKHRSPYLAERYRDVDPDAPDFRIESLPPITKEEVMEHFDEFVTDPRLKLADVMRWASDVERVGRRYRNRWVVTHTSGTTGSPAYFVYDRREWDWIQAFAVTRGVRFKPTFFGFFAYAARILVHKVRVALISVLSGHFVTYVLFRLTPRIGRLVSRFYFLSVIDALPRMVERLNAIRPQVLHCYPTVLESLAYEQIEGRLRIAPWVLSCSSEPLTPNARRVIEQAFPDSPLFETYGTSEGVNLASECQLHNGLHVNSDYFILESVDPQGRRVEGGQSGEKVYLTCLFTRTLPLLRYEISDATTPLSEPCPCGLPYPLLRVQGRTDDTFWVHDRRGELVALPPVPFEALFLAVDGLMQYQLVQQERNRLLVRFRPRAGVPAVQVEAAIREQFARYLRLKDLDDAVAVEVIAVDLIERDERTGKVRQIVSDVERPYLPGVPLGERRWGTERRGSGAEQQPPERRQADRRVEDRTPEGED